MKRLITLSIIMSSAFGAYAQDVEGRVTLDEVTVKAAKVVNKADGMIIYPTDVQKRYSNNGYVFHNDTFMTQRGERIRLTPMQHSLLEMFMTNDTHTLSKQDICERLWPKKPDASDTLYTLIRRIKPIVETNSRLKIESDRGRNYSLRLK